LLPIEGRGHALTDLALLQRGEARRAGRLQQQAASSRRPSHRFERIPSFPRPKDLPPRRIQAG
jgi:hypothetical protein